LRTVTKNQAKSWYSIIFCMIKIVWEIYFSNPFVTSRNISKFLLFGSFPRSKNHLKSCVFSICMMTTMEEQLYGFYQFPGSKIHWEERYFLKFWFQLMSLKREIFVNSLPQKLMTKYGIISTYSVTFFPSQKILVSLQWAHNISCLHSSISA